MDVPVPDPEHARSPAQVAAREPVAVRRPGTGRLFRKYFVLILALVSGALLIPSTISLYFSNRETLDALHAVQREKALAAAGRIEQYIVNVQGQLRGAALPQLGAEGAEQRRIEFLKLLKQVPDVTDIAYVGADGCEKLQVSRLAMDAVGDCLRDRSREPAFREPTSARPWYGSVYFRKETEPYMQIAVRSGGAGSPVAVADVNLKFMWEVITRIRAGEKGKAYLVDSAGYLVADPDIGLVLRKTDLSGLAHVKAALDGSASDDAVVLTRDVGGTEVLTAHANVEPLGWKVFVEQPASEVFARRDAAILRIGLLLLGGLVISALVALFLARGMARPIRTLQEGAELIGDGRLDHEIHIRTGDELEALAGQFNRMTANLRESYAGLERKVDERTHELSNALEQQTAVTEILRVISGSPTDVKPVLDVVAERAALLCNADYSRVLLIEGDVLNPIAGYQHGAPASDALLAVTTNVPFDRTSLAGRAAVDRTTIHLADVLPHLDSDFPAARTNMLRFGLRAVLIVPLMRGDDAYGGMILARTTPGLFRDDQVVLIETFARQAAIAIDNVRLFNRTRESLDQQTAISEILRVTSSSPTDVQPVLQAVAERALALCGASQATIVLVDGSVLRCAAAHGSTTTLDPGETLPLTRGSVAGRAVIDGAVVQVDDLALASEDDYPVGRELQRRVGHRTALAVPLMREGHAIGAIQLWRMEVQPFDDEKVALVRTFAGQAAIAIDNVRLFNQTKEALDQQTAISEILRVISASPTDVVPVLQTVAERAAHLCDAPIATVLLIDGDVLRPVAVHASHSDSGDAFDDPVAMRQLIVPMSRQFVVGRAVLDRATLHYPDVLPLLENEYPNARTFQARFGFRALMAVPLMREGGAYGAILIWRREPRAFTPDQVTLLETFARQAAIAIDNVRLFNQTREALEQQTAISEILRVTSGSPTDVQPVLEVVAERAAALCEAQFAQVLLVENQSLSIAATRSLVQGAVGGLEDPVHMPGPFPLKPTYITGRVALEARTIHYADVTEVLATEFPDAAENQRRFGFRAVLGVPLTREKGVYGVLYVWRREPRAFTPDQIALLETFARQSAIAIDNVRLFNETKEALDQQRASGEVLSAISSSIADTKPVFDVILASCQRLFAGHTVGITMVREDGLLDVPASVGQRSDALRKMFPAPVDRTTASGIAILEGRAISYADVESEDMPPRSREGCLSQGTLSMVFTPMLSEGRAIGTLWVGRPFKGAFSDKQLALIRTFAEQAVIAIQNARLFNETKEALDQQRASGEVLSAISSSIADTKPVFDVILSSCQRLFDGHNVGAIMVRPDGKLDLGAYKGNGFDELSKEIFPMALDRESGSGISILERRVVEIPDALAADVPDRARRGLGAIGVGSVLFAPMLSEGRALGALWVGRREKGTFGEKQIALLKTFAEQAVIAIQNARLFNETKDALEQQRASGEVLSAISSSIADVGPVFDVILGNCQRILGARNVGVTLLRDGMLHVDAHVGPGVDDLKKLFPRPLDRDVGAGLSIIEKRVLHYPDLDAADVPPTLRVGSRTLGDGSFLVAPMMLGERAIGALWLGRAHKGAYSDKELALIRTFAEQAVVALQNSRLFNETREALEQQTATAEVLRVISSSVADTAPVFDKILDSCQRLFATGQLGIFLLEDDGLVHAVAWRGAALEAITRTFPKPGAETITGTVIRERRPVVVVDAAADPSAPPSVHAMRELIGNYSCAWAPMLWEGRGVGSIAVLRQPPAPMSEKDLALLKTFADQAAIAIQNARLFREIQDKSRQLEIASQHKSDFLANMSHELRTPLNAIIGFSEVLLERMFGELNVKQDDYLKDIHSSGKHLLQLINDILDLSKVEAGRMELDPATFDVTMAIGNAMTLVRERAQRHGIGLGIDAASDLGEIVADERKFKQILLNLLTNAVKFTLDGGRVDVIARRRDGWLEVAVRDTGIGIAKEDQEAVFEEFRQVGRHYTNKQEGTGLGLALTRRFVELHGGTLRLESEPGQGSTFTFTIPTTR